MKKRYCFPCKAVTDHYIENEAVDKKCNMAFEYVCSDCGSRHKRKWGKAKTLKYLQGEHVGA